MKCFAMRLCSPVISGGVARVLFSCCQRDNQETLSHGQLDDCVPSVWSIPTL